MGYGIIAVQGNQITMRQMDILRLPASQDNFKRLLLIHQKVEALIREFRPDEFAIEAPFFGKNVQSMLKLGRAQGVAIAAAMSARLPVTEYSPRKIKQAITGNGNADKEKVWKMLQHILVLPEKPRHYDASDALAVAVCHHFQTQAGLPPVASPKKKAVRTQGAWNQFLKNNPSRVRR